MMSFVIKSIRSMFFSLDKIIYGLIDDVYSLLLTIARTSIFDDGTISEFASRIYAIAGIFMLFKVSMSIIQYVINPDALVDKDKGFAALGKRIVFSLILLILCPYLFQEAYELQSMILEENTIMNLVFGTTSIKGIPTDDYAINAGKNIQFTTMYTFMQPNYEEFYVDNEDGINLSACAVTYDSNNYNRDDSSFIRALNSECFGTYKEGDYYDNDGALPKAFEEYAGDEGLGIYQNYAQGVAQQDFNLMMRQDIVLIKDTHDNYIINYKYGISTAVGVAIVYIFLLFCIDIALRSVQLGFLEMIAPIPILSYIETKGKDGMFTKWYKMCFSTYISLFLRLFALYLGVYAITVIGSFTDVVTGEEITGNWLLNVFMIIGILMFAKKLPDIIKDIFGIKMDGKFQLNPFKKIENEALGGKFISGTAKRAIGTAAVVPAVGAASLITGHGFRGMGKAFVGGIRGEKFGKNFSNSYAEARAKHKQLDEMHADGVNRGDVFMDKLYNATHGQTREEQIKNVTGGLKAIQDDYSSYEKTAAGVDKLAKDFDKRKKAAEASGNYAEAKRWSEAFDNRVKEIAASGGMIATDADLSKVASDVDANGNYDIKKFSVTEDKNAALENIGKHMDGLVSAMNSQGASVEGYQTITGKVKDNIKTIKNQALGSQQSIETNAHTQKVHDVAKYSGGKKK